MKRERILLVDDEPRLIKLVQTVLKTAGYEVITAYQGSEAIAMAAVEQPDLILLDLLLPGTVDGIQVCHRIREFSDVPVIMLTARAREEDKLSGFDAGADDYLTKPFSSKELLARVKAVLRRRPASKESTLSKLVCGDIVIDLAQQRVMVRGNEVKLTRTEYQLLRHLAHNAGKVLLHEDLLSLVWGPEYRDEVDYLRDYIRYLRKKIEVDPRQPRCILTKQGVGYYLSKEHNS